MEKNYKIEIVSSESANKKIKEDLLEDLCEKILNVMKYEIYKKVRKREMVQELVANNTANNEKVYIKCIAHRKNISLSDIRQLVASLFFEDIKYGFLLTTAPLAKDAEVLKRKSEGRHYGKKLFYYTPDKIIELLISAKKIINPLEIRLKVHLEIDDNITLIVSDHGYYWFFLIRKSESVSKAALFSVESGKQIFDEKLIQYISNVDWRFKDIQWISESITYDIKDRAHIKEKSRFIYDVFKKLKAIMLSLFINIKNVFRIGK